MSSEIIKAINTNDKQKIIDIIITFIDKRNVKYIKNIIKHIEKNNPKIFEKQEEKLIKKEKKDYNNNYLEELKNELRKNFSKERLELILEVCEVIKSNECIKIKTGSTVSIGPRAKEGFNNSQKISQPGLKLLFLLLMLVFILAFTVFYEKIL